ncbi:putative sulfoacetate transporter SauU [Clostridium homopropionicum DSM 5847]|uniref:Putative sulfoacetate transporter SauU n=1 Tax=Clostridium homopropionicum DSM 5847 TaxID=1121318 RepID=A0A0L6ZEM9_9CLOT|nr:MFS transporter [Clostridium homopropionicum]KOA21444.1 putative sulfoacetate transporter SauU [Clostridium homopropionicum DSM 5847]SFG09630.1 Predicted arabinose efflux permease, MFS family [Clostridium homopropionicum]
MSISNVKMAYTIFIFVALAAFDNIIIGLFPPLFSSIAKEIKVPISSLGIVSAANILVTALSAILWGYLAGKFNRKRLIIIGTIFWSVSVFLTAHCSSYIQLFIFQVFTGIGLGCISSIGFSVLTDYIPHKFRGMLLSLWGMSQGFGGIAGALIASLLATSTSWRTPFEIVSFIGLLLAVLYFFIKEPTLGESEPELQELLNRGFEYNYNIQLKNIYNIISRKSNILLFLQAFFMNITTGTLIWLPTMYISKIQHEGYSLKIAIIASGYLFALFQLGGLTSTIFGYLGDLVQNKTYKGRAILTSFFVFAMMPLYIVMFTIPMNKLVLSSSDNAALVFLELLKQIITNPWIFAIFILSLLASAAQSANTPNWLALITDVNLPENRGAAFSIANLANGLGRTIGNAGVSILLSYISVKSGEPENYIITLAIFQLFLIPSSLLYIKMAKNNEEDINEVKCILNKRAKSIR